MVGAVESMIGFFFRKIAVGRSYNLIKEIMDTVLQFSITNVVAQQHDVLKSITDMPIRRLFYKNLIITEKK